MNKYLVLFGEKFFYCRRTSAGVAVGTLYPSVGRGMPYLVAVEVAEKLRAKGYADAVVTTLHGDPVKPADLASSSDRFMAYLEVVKSVESVWGEEPVTQ
jgi:hypothetical protein